MLICNATMNTNITDVRHHMCSSHQALSYYLQINKLQPIWENGAS